MTATLIVYYSLKEGQTQESFEDWLREVDIPAYARLRSMSSPVYFRAESLLGEDAEPPFAYLAVIDMTGPEDVEAEMSDPVWADFVADFEGRTEGARFVVARRIHP